MFWKSYWEMCSWVRTKSLLAVLAIGLTGFLEGSALLALISVLNGQMETGSIRGSSYIQQIAHWLKVSDQFLIPFALGVFTILGLSAAIFRLISDVLLLNIRTSVERIARQKMSHALLEIEWTYFISLKMGDVTKSLIQEGGLMGAGTHVLLQSLGLMISVCAYLCAAMIISVKMTLLTLLFGFIGGVCYRWGTNSAKKHVDKLSSIMTDIGDRINNVFGSLKYFRATGSSLSAEQNAQEVYQYFAKTYVKGNIVNPIMRSCFDSGSIIFVALFLYTSLMLRKESVASTMVFLAIFYRLAPRLLNVNDFLFQARTYLSWYDTWKERMDFASAHRTRPTGTLSPTFDDELTVESVNFIYPESNNPVLMNISFNLAQGKCLAIVGPSGSGKSTLLDLITGLLTPNRGAIRLDGTLLYETDLEKWRNQIGLVMQESSLFHTSIRTNIAWGDYSPSEDAVISCAKKAHAWEFIEKIPSGIETIIGEKGARLSGGQKQRIALARAIYRKPRLLILDEATSALDSESEAVVQTALEDIKGTCAIIMVAHRLKTVRMADKIIVLDQGQIVEQGTWDVLMNNQNGIFYRMALSQGVTE